MIIEGGENLLSANNQKDEKIVAWDANKEEKYTCPICGESLTLKQGLIKIPHFAHKPDSMCNLNIWEPESERHHEMKREVMTHILRENNCIIADYEHPIDKFIADVYFEIKRGSRLFKVAVECQCSNKTLREFINKTRIYTDNNIHTLWLFDFPKKWQRGKTYLHNEIRPTEIMLEAHKWYYGRIYTLWDDKLIGTHFYRVMREKSFFDRELYEEGWDYDDCLKTYETTLKKVRQPCIADINNWKILNITNNGLFYDSDEYLLARFSDRKWW